MVAAVLKNIPFLKFLAVLNGTAGTGIPAHPCVKNLYRLNLWREKKEQKAAMILVTLGK